ncbi:spermidine/putrescine-binding protein [Bradyrhizobium sp. USDA 328]
MMTTRTFGLSCAVAGAIALGGSAADAAEQITFVSQGGAYQQAQTVAILDPSAKKLGITINQDSIPDAWPAIKTQVGSGKPIWDVVDTPTGYCLRGGEQGLIEKLDFSRIPNAAAMPEAYRSPYSISYEFYSSVLAYSQKTFPKDAARPSSSTTSLNAICARAAFGAPNSRLRRTERCGNRLASWKT